MSKTEKYVKVTGLRRKGLHVELPKIELTWRGKATAAGVTAITLVVAAGLATSSGGRTDPAPIPSSSASGHAHETFMIGTHPLIVDSNTELKGPDGTIFNRYTNTPDSWMVAFQHGRLPIFTNDKSVPDPYVHGASCKLKGAGKYLEKPLFVCAPTKAL